MVQIGSSMRHWRHTRRLTQEELARMVGVERATLANWERGAKQPGLENVVRLSQALGISLGELILGTKEPAMLHESQIAYRTEDPLVQELSRRTGVPAKAIAAFIFAMQATQEQEET